MKQRFYFDTSVFGGVYDSEFDELSLQLFEKVRLGAITCMYSDLTLGELHYAPQRVQDFIKTLPTDHLEFVHISDESLGLARQYIAEKVVGETSFDDCIHIALATIHKADLLVSWNFKHIVNIYRIRGYNSVNLRQGYSTLEIRSPKDIVDYEDETES
ncbi:PIN domain-containing protein [Larkinella sp. VNQ87]|uniref:PIN domain-containing protein n=1 Tax=Larkinella sp. VNQ87 TaxID=3400921 RepID=UPI003BFB6400